MATAFDRLLAGEQPGQVCPAGCSCRGADVDEQAPTVTTTDDAYADQLAETVRVLQAWKRLGEPAGQFR
jgi:hypothetical protein